MRQSPPCQGSQGNISDMSGKSLEGQKCQGNVREIRSFLKLSGKFQGILTDLHGI